MSVSAAISELTGRAKAALKAFAEATDKAVACLVDLALVASSDRAMVAEAATSIVAEPYRLFVNALKSVPEVWQAVHGDLVYAPEALKRLVAVSLEP
jgi:hypothetical protein